MGFHSQTFTYAPLHSIWILTRAVHNFARHEPFESRTFKGYEGVGKIKEWGMVTEKSYACPKRSSKLIDLPERAWTDMNSKTTEISRVSTNSHSNLAERRDQFCRWGAQRGNVQVSSDIWKFAYVFPIFTQFSIEIASTLNNNIGCMKILQLKSTREKINSEEKYSNLFSISKLYKKQLLRDSRFVLFSVSQFSPLQTQNNILEQWVWSHGTDFAMLVSCSVVQKVKNLNVVPHWKYFGSVYEFHMFSSTEQKLLSWKDQYNGDWGFKQLIKFQFSIRTVIVHFAIAVPSPLLST